MFIICVAYITHRSVPVISIKFSIWPESLPLGITQLLLMIWRLCSGLWAATTLHWKPAVGCEWWQILLESKLDHQLLNCTPPSILPSALISLKIQHDMYSFEVIYSSEQITHLSSFCSRLGIQRRKRPKESLPAAQNQQLKVDSSLELLISLDPFCPITCHSQKLWNERVPRQGYTGAFFKATLSPWAEQRVKKACQSCTEIHFELILFTKV